jgi:hypothetical protein
MSVERVGRGAQSRCQVRVWQRLPPQKRQLHPSLGNVTVPVPSRRTMSEKLAEDSTTPLTNLPERQRSGS